MRVVITEDDALLREGLALLLAGEGIDVAAAVGDADALRAAIAGDRPDALIMDVRLPPAHRDEGLRAAVAARAIHPGLPVLVLSAYVEDSHAADLLADGGAGVGYLLKERVGKVAEFVAALRQVAAGGTVMDPEVIAQLLTRRKADDPLSALTPREREVLALMAEGHANADIAGRLSLSPGAVHKHVGNIFDKLGLPPDGCGHRRVRAVLTYLGV